MNSEGVCTIEEGWARYFEGFFEKSDFLEFELLTFIQMIIDENLKYPPDYIINNFVTKRRCDDASKFLSTNMRNILDLYCRFLKEMGKLFKGNIDVGKDIVNVFISTLTSTVNIPLGSAIGLFCWMEKYAIKKWCNDYCERDIDGNGYYFLDKYNKQKNSEKKYDGEFSGKYYPPIEHFVKDNKSSDMTVYIAVDAQVVGVFEPKDSSFFDYLGFETDNIHLVNVTELSEKLKYAFEVDTTTIEIGNGNIFFYNKVGSSIEITQV